MYAFNIVFILLAECLIAHLFFVAAWTALSVIHNSAIFFQILLVSSKQWGGIKMQWYLLCLSQSHAVVCGCPPTEERDVIQTLNCSHERTVQLTQPVSLFKHLLILWFHLMLSATTDQMASWKCRQAPPCSVVVGTNSPLILLMPELGLLYILSSSDPLCRKRDKRHDSQAQLWNNGESCFQTGPQRHKDNNKTEVSEDNLK